MKAFLAFAILTTATFLAVPGCAQANEGNSDQMSIESFLIQIDQKFTSRSIDILNLYLDGNADFPLIMLSAPGDWLKGQALNSHDFFSPLPYSRRDLQSHIRNLAESYWDKNCRANSDSTFCTSLLQQMMGAAVVNGLILNDPHSDLQKEIIHILEFTSGTDDRRALLVYIMSYHCNPQVRTLQGLSWTFSRASGVISGSGPTWEEVQDDSKNNYRSLVNNFRIYIFMLQRSLDNQHTEDIFRPSEIAEQRFRNLLPFIQKIVGKKDEGGNLLLSPKELYTSLGTALRFYEARSQFSELNQIVIGRGILRATYKDITPSCLSRLGHSIYGIWTDFGTSISKPIFLYIGIYILSLIVVIFSSLCHELQINSSILNSAFELMTLRSQNIPIPPSAKLAIEVLSTSYFALMFSYLFSFFANWR